MTEAEDATVRLVQRALANQKVDELFPANLTLDITPVDCLRGVRQDDNRCVAARALGRRFDGADIRVGTGWIEIRHQHQKITYLVPPALREQIRSFDRGGAFVPGAYTLRRFGEAPKAVSLPFHPLLDASY